MLFDMIKAVLGWIAGCFGIYLGACFWGGVDPSTAVTYLGYATVGGVIIIPVIIAIAETFKSGNS